MAREDGFLDCDSDERPQALIQWKGTDLCMDFHCECGADCHFDGDFAYTVKCPHCLTVWEMPCHIYPRKASEKTYAFHREGPKMLIPDESYCETVLDTTGGTFVSVPVRLPARPVL